MCGYRSCRSYEIVRIKALVSRVFISAETPQEEPTTYVIGDYQLDTLKEQLIFANENITATVIPLSHRESEILRLLCCNKGEVVDNKDVLLQLWGDDSYFNTRSLHVFITKLRRKLSRDPRVRIINVRGIGYKLIG
ncbi:MAG: winged helix-turn-helix domain-containing protein [Prevotella sp.]|nr:winged helix-turn-helix domain-containing protein [Prevotella sp.]